MDLVRCVQEDHQLSDRRDSVIVKGDIERVNLQTGDRWARISGDGESRLVGVDWGFGPPLVTLHEGREYRDVPAPTFPR